MFTEVCAFLSYSFNIRLESIGSRKQANWKIFWWGPGDETREGIGFHAEIEGKLGMDL